MPRKSFWIAASLGALSSLAGCGPMQYIYTPATTTLTSSEPARGRNAEYPFPPDSPHGDIRLATSGVARVSAGEPNVVRLRMVIRNRSEERWLIDTSEQKLVLATSGDERPLAKLATLPVVVEVWPAQSTTIDLAFALPPTASKPDEIPAFDAVWTVHVGARPITTTTTFERMLAPELAQEVPKAGLPFYRGTPPAQERMPGTGDSRWTETQPIPDRGLY